MELADALSRMIGDSAPEQHQHAQVGSTLPSVLIVDQGNSHSDATVVISLLESIRKLLSDGKLDRPGLTAPAAPPVLEEIISGIGRIEADLNRLAAGGAALKPNARGVPSQIEVELKIELAKLLAEKESWESERMRLTAAIHKKASDLKKVEDDLQNMASNLTGRIEAGLSRLAAGVLALRPTAGSTSAPQGQNEFPLMNERARLLAEKDFWESERTRLTKELQEKGTGLKKVEDDLQNKDSDLRSKERTIAELESKLNEKLSYERLLLFAQCTGLLLVIVFLAAMIVKPIVWISRWIQLQGVWRRPNPFGGNPPLL